MTSSFDVTGCGLDTPQKVSDWVAAHGIRDMLSYEVNEVAGRTILSVMHARFEQH